MAPKAVRDLLHGDNPPGPITRRLRHLYHDARVNVRGARRRSNGVAGSPVYDCWWYYGAELAPGVTLPGSYPEDFPFAPRVLLRNCDLAGMDCADLGTMEGVTPVLMCRQGARHVVAADANYDNYEKLVTLKKAYGVDFDYRQVGLMYDLSAKLKGYGGFDLVNFAGVLYHVFSPMHVLAGVRPLIKKNGLFITSTNVVRRDDNRVDFNTSGRLQTGANTFWYLSIPVFEYLLRYFKLAPIDCLYVPHASTRLQNDEVDSGLLTVVCRAVDEATGEEDEWARNSTKYSWEYKGLCDLEMLEAQPVSGIRYNGSLARHVPAPDGRSIDLLRSVEAMEPYRHAEQSQDTYLLKLADRS